MITGPQDGGNDGRWTVVHGPVPTPRRRGLTPHDARMLALSAIVVVALLAGLVVVGTTGPSWPDEWDPRVAPLVAFVEEAHGDRFDHPVHVDFLDAAAYREAATDGLREPDDETRRFFALQVRELRALGLLGGDPDLAAEMSELVDQGTLAFYDPSTRRITVRGQELTVGLRVTIVHELAHALQDQAFGTGGRDIRTDGEDFALRALLEGDAMRIEQEYIDSLTDGERAELEAEEAAARTSASPLSTLSARAILAFFEAPYAFGSAFVRFLDGDDGDDAIDAALNDPPVSEADIVDPLTFRSDDGPEDVDAPEVPRGAKEVRELSDEVGAVTWYLMLATHLDQARATTAVVGWDGDRRVAYETDGRLCIAARVRARTDNDASELAAALDDLADALPSHDATSGRDGLEVSWLSCDPGPSASDPAIDLDGIFLTPLFRTELLTQAFAGGASEQAAACIAGAFITTWTLDELRDAWEAESADDPAITRLRDELDAARGRCG
jgi:hypothetical protein